MTYLVNSKLTIIIRQVLTYYRLPQVVIGNLYNCLIANMHAV